MTKILTVASILVLIAYPLYSESTAQAPAAVPAYDQPDSRLSTEPTPRTTNPNTVPANRNPYFDDPPSHVEGVPTGNPEASGQYDPNAANAAVHANNPDAGTNSINGGIGHSGTSGIQGSGD